MVQNAQISLNPCYSKYSKLGGLKDYSDVDDVTPRAVFDLTENNHGKALCEFLVDSKCCVLGGRITPQYDNYTYVSTRGTSVVDHFITAHDCVNNVTECRVDLCSDIIKDLGIESMISDTCKVPDHSLLTIQIKTSPYSLES